MATLAGGAFNAVSARLVEDCGFDAAYISGAGTALSVYGYPDVGLVTSTEMSQFAASIVRAVNIPVIVDAENGYGGSLNAFRSTRDFANAGVAAIHIEDKTFDDCSTTGSRLLPSSDAERRIASAVAATDGYDIRVIARTDALISAGMDVAVTRALAYADCGADLIFVEGIANSAEAAVVASRLAKHQTVFNLSSRVKDQSLSFDRLSELGFDIILLPNYTLRASISATERTLRDILKHRGVPQLDEARPSRDVFAELAKSPTVTSPQSRRPRLEL